MQRLIRTVALAAAIVVLATSLWQGWGLATTVKRLVVACLGFFALGTLAVFALRAGAPDGNPSAASCDRRRDHGNGS